MKIVSLVPSATEILCALGLADDIVAISHDCDHPAEIVNRPRMTATRLPPDLSSHEIDERVRQSAASGCKLHAIDKDLLRKLDPDLVVTQEQCSVCAIDRDGAICAVDEVNPSLKWLSLCAADFDGLYHDIRKLGEATSKRTAAESVICELTARLEFVVRQTTNRDRPRVFCLSWFDPLMAAGCWINEMVALAGGRDPLASDGVFSSPIAATRLLEDPPQFIFLMPCSFSQNRSLREWNGLSASKPWIELPAVREGRVFALESCLFHRSGPRLVQGVELMAALLHPNRFSFSGKHELSLKVA